MTRLDADWVGAPASQAVMIAIGTGFFVGGCVRNALLGEPVSDIDIATPVPPDEVKSRLEAAGLKAVPTGLAHGTITAVHDGVPVEVTTFRADVSTDGRRATVAFTDSMETDAGRRDFTMNALYADSDGHVLDPLGGLPDLLARRLRFIGDAHARIREDYLRILRFFRFHAWFGADGIDREGLAACAELAEGLDNLARERVGWEMRKLLSAPDPAPAVASMASTGILMRCLPGALSDALAALVHLEGEAEIEPDWRRRLAVLGGQHPETALRLSRAEARDMAAIQRSLALSNVREAAYRYGAEAASAAVLVASASMGSAPMPGWQQDVAVGATAKFPLIAADLIAAGWAPGPALGDALDAAERAWISSGFELDAAALIETLRA